MLDINPLTLEQLYELNERICQRIDELHDQKDREALARLRPGLKVQFDHNNATFTGRVIKLNRKTVLVASEDGTKHWKVALGLVKTV